MMRSEPEKFQRFNRSWIVLAPPSPASPTTPQPHHGKDVP